MIDAVATKCRVLRGRGACVPKLRPLTSHTVLAAPQVQGTNSSLEQMWDTRVAAQLPDLSSYLSRDGEPDSVALGLTELGPPNGEPAVASATVQQPEQSFSPATAGPDTDAQAALPLESRLASPRPDGQRGQGQELPSNGASHPATSDGRANGAGAAASTQPSSDGTLKAPSLHVADSRLQQADAAASSAGSDAGGTSSTGAHDSLEDDFTARPDRAPSGEASHHPHLQQQSRSDSATAPASDAGPGDAQTAASTVDAAPDSSSACSDQLGAEGADVAAWAAAPALSEKTEHMGLTGNVPAAVKAALTETPIESRQQSDATAAAEAANDGGTSSEQRSSPAGSARGSVEGSANNYSTAVHSDIMAAIAARAASSRAPCFRNPLHPSPTTLIPESVHPLCPKPPTQSSSARMSHPITSGQQLADRQGWPDQMG